MSGTGWVSAGSTSHWDLRYGARLRGGPTCGRAGRCSVRLCASCDADGSLVVRPLSSTRYRLRERTVAPGAGSPEADEAQRVASESEQSHPCAKQTTARDDL